MNLDKVGLVLEGGGLRGVYTSGVLHHFMLNNLYLNYVIGVSMGACNAANYISRQPGRNRIVNINFVNDKRYLSYFNLFTKGELFGMDFIFKTIPNSLDLFDYDTFLNNKSTFIMVATDCFTGDPLYFDKNDLGMEFMHVLQASSSLPLINKPVVFHDYHLLDGGISDSIPIWKSIKDGNKKNVVILTQPKGYLKKEEKLINLTKYFYPQYTGLLAALKKRHIQYNETLNYINEEEAKGNVFVIRPEEKLIVGRIERNKNKLNRVYEQGLYDAKKIFPSLIEFLGE